MRFCCGETFSEAQSSSQSSDGSGSFAWLEFPFHPQPKKERRTKDAQARPAKAHTERALADAPCGARLKALSSVSKTWRFCSKQRLDARASIQIVTDQRSLMRQKHHHAQTFRSHMVRSRRDSEFIECCESHGLRCECQTLSR